jgi:hypothetical protein
MINDSLFTLQCYISLVNPPRGMYAVISIENYRHDYDHAPKSRRVKLDTLEIPNENVATHG